MKAIRNVLTWLGGFFRSKSWRLRRDLLAELDHATIQIHRHDPWSQVTDIHTAQASIKPKLEELRQRRVGLSDEAELLAKRLESAATLAPDSPLTQETRTLIARLHQFEEELADFTQSLGGGKRSAAPPKPDPTLSSRAASDPKIAPLRQRLRQITFYMEDEIESLLAAKRRELPRASEIEIYQAVIADYDEDKDASRSG